MDLERVVEGALDITQPDVRRAGGIAQLKKTASMAEASQTNSLRTSDAVLQSLMAQVCKYVPLYRTLRSLSLNGSAIR